jgi:hypothetical protein
MWNKRKRFVESVAVVGLVAALAGCETVPTEQDFHPQAGAPHTLTYKDATGKETVSFDLTGKWETQYFGDKEVVNIKQTRDRFEGYKTIGSRNKDAGALTIQGEVNGGWVNCLTYLSRTSSVLHTSKLSRNVDEFECGGEGPRKFKRVE